MRAMVLRTPGRSLKTEEWPSPEPGDGEVRVAVSVCGVCRTDLHIIDGELATPVLPLVPGHQIVGTVDALGPGVGPTWLGRRLGVPWLGRSCGTCPFCRRDQENLCDSPRFTGFHGGGGYADFAVADIRFCHEIPAGIEDAHAAPLLCAGLIGFRALAMVGDAECLGLYGFGASAHILAQILSVRGRRFLAVVRDGDEEGARFARSLGAFRAGAASEVTDGELDAAIIFAPAGNLVPEALRAVRKGGVVVCAGIHMTDIPAFPYSLLWGERAVRSVANLTRADGREFFAAVTNHPVRTEISVYPLEDANRALSDLRAGRISGAAVLDCATPE